MRQPAEARAGLYFRRRKKIMNGLAAVFFVAMACVLLLPIVYTVFNSFMSSSEISRYYVSALTNEGAGGAFHLIPDRFSLEAYYQVLLRRPDYLSKFWNSLLLCGGILIGQVTVSCLGGFAFSKYEFPLKNMLFYILIVLMMLPVQVTLVSNYIVLDAMNLINTWWALILPYTFLPFGTFLMTQIFRGVPNEVVDAAMLDGAGTLGILTRVMVPASKGGIISLLLLSFIDSWNMVEQPIAYLKDSTAYPLSVFLASGYQSNVPLSFACGMLAMLPVLLLFLFFNEELVEGIEFSGLK